MFFQSDRTFHFARAPKSVDQGFWDLTKFVDRRIFRLAHWERFGRAMDCILDTAVMVIVVLPFSFFFKMSTFRMDFLASSNFTENVFFFLSVRLDHKKYHDLKTDQYRTHTALHHQPK